MKSATGSCPELKWWVNNFTAHVQINCFWSSADVMGLGTPHPVGPLTFVTPPLLRPSRWNGGLSLAGVSVCERLLIVWR